MSSLERLQKALEQFPKAHNVCASGNCPAYDKYDVQEMDDWLINVRWLFSVFRAEYDGQVAEQTAQQRTLFVKCAYVDFEGNPAFLCTSCRFNHGLRKGCSWEEDRKKVFAEDKSFVHVSRQQLTDERLRLEKEIGHYILEPVPKRYDYWKDMMLGRLSLIDELLKGELVPTLTRGDVKGLLGVDGSPSHRLLRGAEDNE